MLGIVQHDLISTNDSYPQTSLHGRLVSSELVQTMRVKRVRHLALLVDLARWLASNVERLSRGPIPEQ
jgi:hypothetical protein